MEVVGRRLREGGRCLAERISALIYSCSVMQTQYLRKFLEYFSQTLQMSLILTKSVKQQGIARDNADCVKSAHDFTETTMSPNGVTSVVA